MNTAPSGSEVISQRKRVGRPPKPTQSRQSNSEGSVEEESPSTSETAMSKKDVDDILVVDGAALAISPPLVKDTTDACHSRVPAAPTTSGECRRSSRKKIIKFDVRDLLNKHRKPHKIQIEARIDSNAPQTPKSTASGSMGSGTASGTSVPASNSDLSSKQKAFMEKSAIFRRISISEKQNQLNAPPLPPPLSAVPKMSMLGTINRKSNADVLAAMDPAKIAQARRLSRTQEIFNASLMKSKQNSSLIVAQIESSSCSSSSGLISQKVSTPPQQKKATNVSTKRKSIPNSLSASMQNADVQSSTPETGVQKRRGRPPKNKAPLAQTKNKITVVGKNLDQQKYKSLEDVTKELEKNDAVRRANLSNATNWKEYKATLNRVSNSAKASQIMASRVQKPLQQEKKSTFQNEDVILEISSTSSASDHEIQQETTSTTTNPQESPPRNFASVCILQESPSVCEVTDAEEFIVAAVEEITTENSQSAKSISLEPGDITTSAQDVANVVVVGDEQNTININLNMDISKETEIASNSFSEVTYRESYGSRKSSGSESESGSDRSNKSYKKGDKLRISVKRLTMPQDECVSTISLSSASNSCSDIVVGSSANNNRNNNSGENNGATTESNTVATSKALPTRRSHRIPRRSTANKSKSSESDSDSKISSNESFDTKIEMKMTEKETEKTGGLPVELSVLKNDGKTDIDFEQLSTVDENNVTVKAIENVVDAVQVEERQLAIKAAQNSIVEVSAVQVKETSLACIINVKDLVERVEDGRKEYEKQVSGTCSLSQVVVPSTSHETKKDRITLPIKKQASKFKMYEEAVHNVAANVETSTLLDILKTVKQNDLTMGTTEGTLQKEAQVEIPTACQQMQLKTLVNKEEKIETNCAANETHTSKEMLIDTKTLIASEHPSDTNVDIKSSGIQEMSPDRKVRIDEKFEETLEILPVENPTDQRQLAVVKFDSLKDAISEVLAERASPAVQSPEGSTATEAIPDNSSAEKLKSHTADNATILSDFSQEGSRASKSSTKVCNVLNLTDNLESQSITNEAATGQVLDESSMGGVSPTTDSQPSGDEQAKVATKKTPSPTPSENSIGCYSKKPTRRYERRSQRGDVSAHKTLEETFAEIAAESSKAVLDLKAKKVETPKESSATITDTLSNAVELEKSAEKSSSSDIPANVVVVNKCKATDNATLTMTIETNRTPSPKLEDDKVLTTSTESNSSPKLEDDKVLTTSAQNFEEATAKVASPEINSKSDCSFSKLLSVLDDGDSNSNHSSPSRRRGRQRNKKDKDINKSSPSIEATKEVPIEGPSDTITNPALECKSLLIPAPDSHTAANVVAKKASKQKLINMASSAPEGNVLKIAEADLRPESVTQIVEPPESTPLEEEFANAAETEIVLETAIIADIQDDQAEMAEITVETTELEIPENQESQDANASASISTVTSGEVSPKGTKERKEKIKSRKHKKETNSSSSEAHQAKNSKLERQMEELPKSLTSTEDSPKNATENALQNETRIEPTAATKEDTAATTSTKEDQSAEIKICADNCEGKAQKADNQMVEQRSQSETQLAKPKKEKKRKNTKQYSDDKLGDIKDLNSSTEENKILESKGKNNEAGDVVGKTRKPRKGKTAQEPIKKGNTSDVDAVSESVAVETAEKESLAKAPPKKRLLKMQMQLEEKSASACYSVSSELATTSAADVETKSPSAKKAVTETGKTNESSHKKTNKGTQVSDDKKRTSFESQQESSVEEESRSATSTPLAKRFKHQKSLEKTPEDKAKSSSKRKPKLDLLSGSAEKLDTTKPEIKDKDKPLSASKKSEKKKFVATEESASNESGQKMEDKNAKKKRQKKLKEAFEAALKDALLKSEDHTDSSKSSVNAAAIDVPSITEDRVEQSPPAATAVAADQQVSTAETVDNQPPQPIIANEPEEEPDPLKDIEKFIEDGVNLLKRGYKIEDDSVDEVICPKPITKQDDFNSEITKQVEEATAASNSPIVEGMITPNESIYGEVTPPDKSFEEPHSAQSPNIYYETPADTPVSTPTTTPPPKSPSYDSSFDEISGVRRSHRIKLITKTPKALVGRGLVREKERFSIKDDVEMKTHYSLDDHLTDLAQVEAKNAKFLKEMEERLSNFHVIKENEYKCERVISREARKMVCDCFLTSEEEVRGELGCGEDCLNRLLMIECGPDCNVKDRCTNKRFQKLLCSPCRVFRTEKKGFGIMADIEILPGEFIMEYVGEVINGDEFERRRIVYSQDKNRHYYFMALRSDAIIDATIKGNISRFINHSCDPNAETQKWTVNGELRIGFFSRKSIMPGEEITFDYQYQRYGREAQRCYCESANCRGWIGEEPNSDEGEQIDDDSDADNLADGSDEDESDDSIGDGEDAHKKLDADGTANKSAFGGEDDKLKLEEKLDGSGKEKKKKEEEDDDTKIKLKKLSGKSLDKASRKKKQNKEKKEKRLRKTVSGKPSKTSRYLEDPDIEDEVKFLSRGGLRNQSDTLRFSRLVVRAKLPQTRLNLLKILRNAEVPCRRLFLDYHGLRLLHGWMCEDGGDMAIRLSLLEALESLPIANKTVLTDSKVYQSVRNWCGNSVPDNSGPAGNTSSPSDESSKESSSSNSQPEIVSGQEVPSELQKLAIKLTTAWNSLPEIFRIPKRERIEQMKEHEREADRQFAEASVDNSRSVLSDRYQRDRFGRGPTTSRYTKPSFSKDNRNGNISTVGSMSVNDPRRRTTADSNNVSNDNMKHLSKEQRREMFAAKVARDEAEKRMAEERREFETKCRFFGLEPKKTRPQDVPFCVDPSTGQWYSVARQPIPTPPCYAHVQVHPKPKSTDPADYKLPTVVSSLPHQWKYAITALGQIYYYHAKQRIPQWHPPTPEQLRADAEGADSSDSESCEEAKLVNESSEEDEVLMGMDEAQLKAFIDKKVEHRRNKRYNRLVDERPISPRKEEDRIYNQMEMRKYKENKEKIRKRKEEIRRKRAEALKAAASGGINPSDTGENPTADSIATKFKNGNNSDDPDGAIPIQDYLLSSDEEEIMKAECDNSPLLDKIVQGDKIVDELDALTTKRALKRPLPPHRDLSAQPGPSNAAVSSSVISSVSAAGGSSEHKRRKSDKKEKSKKSKDSDSKYRRNKEKFRCEIAGIIVQHLKPYRKESCSMGRIQSNEDFNHLARKLTHFVMVKELKYCESVGQILVVTESVKNKSREFIKKYMAKYGGSYVRPANDPEFKDIPFTL